MTVYTPTIIEVQKRFKKLKYKLFTKHTKPFNLNIIGWRHPRKIPDTFADVLAVYWSAGTHWEVRSWPITTKPGVRYLEEPINERGTAILVPGQYVDAYAVGPFRRYEALKQVAPVSIYRDNNRDSKFDKNPDNIDTGLFGIHIHAAGIWSKIVGISSAGCQVFQKREDFNEFISLCKQATRFYGNRFTYTLLDY